MQERGKCEDAEYMPWYFGETELVYKSNLHNSIKCRLKRPQKFPCLSFPHFPGRLGRAGKLGLGSCGVKGFNPCHPADDFLSSELDPRQSMQKVTLVLLNSKKWKFLLVSGMLLDNTGLLPFSKESHMVYLWHAGEDNRLCMLVWFFFPIFHDFWNFRAVRSVFPNIRWKSLFPSNTTDNQTKKF